LSDEDCLIAIVMAEGDLDGAILVDFCIAFALDLIALFRPIPGEADVVAAVGDI
jgi:hypothetical protein